MAKIKVLAATGMVPVKALVAGTTTSPGDIFGVTPQRLAALLAKDEVQTVEIDAGVETEEVEIDLAGRPIEQPLDADEFVLPDGWRGLHHSKLIQLAKKLDPEVSTKAEATAVLEAYEAAMNSSE